MKKEITITLIIALIILILGFKAINTWATIKRIEMIFSQDWQFHSCKISRTGLVNEFIECK